MTNQQIVLCWKDESHFADLSDEEKDLIPANPAGMGDLDEADLLQVSGGTDGLLTTLSAILTTLLTLNCTTLPPFCPRLM